MAASSVGEALRLRKAVDTHHGFVVRVLRNLGVPDSDVDDAAQQVFLVLARHISELERSKQRAFLFQTCLRVASNARRSHSRRPSLQAEDAPESVCTQLNPEELLDAVRAQRRLVALLDAMAWELRTVFVLYEIEGFTMAQIASTLELPAGTVASRLRRARAQFKRQVRSAQGSEQKRPLPGGTR